MKATNHWQTSIKTVALVCVVFGSAIAQGWFSDQHRSLHSSDRTLSDTIHWMKLQTHYAAKKSWNFQLILGHLIDFILMTVNFNSCKTLQLVSHEMGTINYVSVYSAYMFRNFIANRQFVFYLIKWFSARLKCSNKTNITMNIIRLFCKPVQLTDWFTIWHHLLSF